MIGVSVLALLFKAPEMALRLFDLLRWWSRMIAPYFCSCTAAVNSYPSLTKVIFLNEIVKVFFYGGQVDGAAFAHKKKSGRIGYP
ncbi:MAG: hypothetical protein VCF07_14685 [Nitrospinota bacterium]